MRYARPPKCLMYKASAKKRNFAGSVDTLLNNIDLFKQTHINKFGKPTQVRVRANGEKK